MRCNYCDKVLGNMEGRRRKYKRKIPLHARFCNNRCAFRYGAKYCEQSVMGMYIFREKPKEKK